MAAVNGPWSWTVNHFPSQSLRVPSKPAMFPNSCRGVANSVEGTGPVEVQDITFATTVTAEGCEHIVTVYFHRSGPDGKNLMRLMT